MQRARQDLRRGRGHRPRERRTIYNRGRTPLLPLYARPLGPAAAVARRFYAGPRLMRTVCAGTSRAGPPTASAADSLLRGAAFHAFPTVRMAGSGWTRGALDPRRRGGRSRERRLQAAAGRLRQVRRARRRAPGHARGDVPVVARRRPRGEVEAGGGTAPGAPGTRDDRDLVPGDAAGGRLRRRCSTVCWVTARVEEGAAGGRRAGAPGGSAAWKRSCRQRRWALDVPRTMVLVARHAGVPDAAADLQRRRGLAGSNSARLRATTAWSPWRSPCADGDAHRSAAPSSARRASATATMPSSPSSRSQDQPVDPAAPPLQRHGLPRADRRRSGREPARARAARCATSAGRRRRGRASASGRAVARDRELRRQRAAANQERVPAGASAVT